MRVALVSSLAVGINGDPPVRRMSQLNEMMSNYNSGFSIVKHFAYGCNCNMLVGDRPLSQSGHGQPIDSVDSTCKLYKSCQQCVIDHYGDSCIGEFTDYNFSINNGEAVCNDQSGTCARAVCECDAEFALAHSETVHDFNQDFSHIFAAFQFETICRKHL